MKNNIAIIGTGATGSSLVRDIFYMFKNRKDPPHLFLYDRDLVEERNTRYTIYKTKDIDEPKVEVLKKRYEHKIPTAAFAEEYLKQEFLGDSIIVSCVDTMRARKDIWFQTAYKQPEKVRYFFDCRAGWDVYRVYAINPRLSEERQLYEESLYSDEEVKIEPCSMRNKECFSANAKKAAEEIKLFLKTGKVNQREFIFDLKFNEIILAR